MGNGFFFFLLFFIFLLSPRMTQQVGGYPTVFFTFINSSVSRKGLKLSVFSG